jgi:hypothetical protein
MGTEPKGDKNPSVEITPEMIEAGREVLWEEIRFWDDELDYDPAEVAAQVFRAMMKARRSSS